MAEITSGTYVRRCNRVSAAILSAFESSASIPPLRQTLSRAERSGRFRQVQPSCRHTAPIRIISYSRSSGTCTPCNRNHRPFGPELRPEQGWFHEEQVGNRYSLASPSASFEIGHQPAAISAKVNRRPSTAIVAARYSSPRGSWPGGEMNRRIRKGWAMGKRHIAVRRPATASDAAHPGHDRKGHDRKRGQGNSHAGKHRSEKRPRAQEQPPNGQGDAAAEPQLKLTQCGGLTSCRT